MTTGVAPRHAAPPLDALARTRRTLGALLAGRALLAGAAAAVALLAVLRLLAWLDVAPSLAASGAARAAAVVVGALVTAILLRRTGRLTAERVALWVEERVPGLDYALVTAAEPRHAALVPRLAPRLARVPWPALRRSAARRALLAPAAALVVAGAAWLLVPRAVAADLTAADGAASGAARATGAGSGAPRSVLGDVRAVVRPPAYANLPVERVDDPVSVAGLVGSAVELRGGEPGAVRATLDGRAVAARDGEVWSVSFTMPERAGVVRLADDAGERLVILEPRPDSVPVVTLVLPASDTVVREPAGTIALLARAHDDVGLASGAFEYIVSSGEGEAFTFRTGTLGAAAPAGRRDAEWRATLTLGALELKPGDVVHVRAVARDGNTLSGPGIGASETRAIRVARVGEGDSVAVEGAPPPAADTTALSQRMLLMLAERLEERRPRLARDVVVRDSRAIAVDQTVLRKRVGELVYMRLGEGVDGEHTHFAGDGHEHGPETRLDEQSLLARASAATGSGLPGMDDLHGDETPIVAINRPLLEAYNHMWDATRALDLGEPDEAIPPMRRALDALQKARQAERIYLRGQPPPVVVDLARVRLQGAEKGSDSRRTPARARDDADAARAQRLDAALAMLASPATAVAVADSLLLLRVDAIGANAPLAAALDEAVRALRAGRDATAALQRARRAALGAPERGTALPRWGGGA